MNKEKLLIDATPPVAFHRELAQIFGINGALFVQQFYYWSDKGNRADGFIYKTKDEIQYETCLTVRKQDKVRRSLEKSGLLETKIHKANGVPTLHYRLNIPAICEIVKSAQRDMTKSKNPLSGYDKSAEPNMTKAQNPRSMTKSKTPLTETTTENTTKTTTTAKAVKKEKKERYGELQTVLLSSDERSVLESQYSAAGKDLNVAIEILDSYIGSTEKKYKSHRAVLKKGNWVWERTPIKGAGVSYSATRFAI